MTFTSSTSLEISAREKRDCRSSDSVYTPIQKQKQIKQLRREKISEQDCGQIQNMYKYGAVHLHAIFIPMSLSRFLILAIFCHYQKQKNEK